MHRGWGTFVGELVEQAASGDIARVRASILEELETRVHSAGASFYTFGPDACADPDTVNLGIGRTVLERVTSVWAAQLAELEGAPLASAAELGVARLDDVVWGKGTARGTRTWREVFMPIGVSDTLSAFITVPGAAPRLLVLFRTGDERFSVEDREAVRYLLPFLSMAEQRAESPVTRLPLTPAQKKIVELLRRGLTNEEIGNELALSALTVRNQLSQVYERCAVGSRVELMALMERPPAKP